MEITVQKRDTLGKTATKKVRNVGQIPATVYGLKKEPVSITVSLQNFNTILKEARGSKTVFTLQVESNGNLSNERVLVYHIDRDAISRDITHAEFLRADESKKLKVEVPVTLVGRSPGAKLGGVLIQKTNIAKIECVPSQIPDHIEVDISNLNIGDSIRIRDFDTKGQFEFLNASDDAIVSVASSRSAEEANAATEGGDKKADPKAAGKPAAKPAAKK